MTFTAKKLVAVTDSVDTFVKTLFSAMDYLHVPHTEPEKLKDIFVSIYKALDDNESNIRELSNTDIFQNIYEKIKKVFDNKKPKVNADPSPPSQQATHNPKVLDSLLDTYLDRTYTMSEEAIDTFFFPHESLSSLLEKKTRTEKVQEQAKHLKPIVYHILQSVNSEQDNDLLESDVYKVLDIIAQLRVDFDLIWRELLDVDCKLLSAEKDLPLTDSLATTLLNKKSEFLKCLDLLILPITFEFLASSPIIDTADCVAWLEGQSTLGPFATSLVNNKMHVAMFNIPAAFSLEEIFLIVRSGDHESEIPLKDIPQNVSSTVIVVTQPKIIEHNGEPQIDGFKAMIFLDHSLVKG